MGTDTPLAVLSERPRLLFDYFKQLFAQVTNPPLDAIREEVVTAVGSTVGPEANLLDPGPEQLSSADPAVPDHRQRRTRQDHPHQRRRRVVPACVPRCCPVCTASRTAAPGSPTRIDAVCQQASEAIESGARILVLSDRNADTVDAPIPSLLLTAAVHHHLVRTKQRTMAGLIVETGDAREVHHMALLIGYGAGAINPYLAFESIEDLIAEGMHGMGDLDPRQGDRATTSRRRTRASSRSCRRWASRRSRPTPAPRSSRRSGSATTLVDEYFTGTISKLGGIGLDEIAEEVAARHAAANPRDPRSGRTASSNSAASTSGVARANPTCSTPRPCTSCSTPRAAAATTSSRSTRRRSTTSRRS